MEARGIALQILKPVCHFSTKTPEAYIESVG